MACFRPRGHRPSITMTVGSLLWASSIAACAVPVLGAQAPTSPSVDPRLYAGLTWRSVGPFRAGRVAAVTGVIGQPGVFYAGFPGGGVWKTTSAGQVWFPVFDSVRDVSSVGAVEVAPSDPNVVYVGTGDMITGGTLDRGKGVYRSNDAGQTWQHLGLDETRHIQTMLVDVHDPNTILVGSLGEPTRRSDARGVYRSTDGGRTWTKVLYIDDETGIAKIARAFDTPDVVFATTMRHYVPPDYAPDRLRSPQFSLERVDSAHTGTAIYVSRDGGVTWRELVARGLPRLVGRTSIAVANGTSAQRVYLITNEALYRSDDGGASWRQMAADDERIRNGQGGYSSGVYVDPQNPDVVYTLNTASYKSVDGGRTFTGFKGAPGGDDPQQAWIDPTNGQRMLFGYDQGAIVTLDGGGTWSSWYNQPTEQIYHVAADNSFPYWTYATQQDAGALRTRSRGNYGAVTWFDWNSVNGWEWGTVLPDPLNPNVVYASGNGIIRITYPSEQWIDVSPAVDPAARARSSSSAPMLFAPWNQHLLIAGLNFVASSNDGGVHWTRLSPELGIPAGMDSATAARTPGGRGAIESMAASTVAPGTIWVGTTNGLVHVTRNGGRTWTDVSIPGLPTPRRALVTGIDASHHDAGTAYVAIEYLRLGDHAPYLYRTRDYGTTWTRIVTGLPTDDASGSFARAIRADTRRAGLLFAGTESSVYVSFDDGDHWQSLRQNLPNTSVRDIQIKGNDLIIGTHGRSIWILDDISTLRQLQPSMASTSAHLFAPGDAVRVRRNVNADTPLPPEIPHALNPLEGVIVDYWLGATPRGLVTLEVVDARGRPIRHLSSAAIAPVAEAARPPHPNFWVGSPTVLGTAVGTNRVTWDLRRDAPPAFSHSFPISANPGLTPATPEGPLVPPGTYSLRLTVDGATQVQSVIVRNDPRSPATLAAVVAQDSLLLRLSDGMRATWGAQARADSLRTAVVSAARAPAAKGAAELLLAGIDSVAGDGAGRRGVSGPSSFRALNDRFGELLTAQDNGDMAPTPAMRAAYAAACRATDRTMRFWQRLLSTGLPALNTALAAAGSPLVAAPKAVSWHPGC